MPIPVHQAFEPWAQSRLRRADIVNACSPTGGMLALPPLQMSGPKGGRPGSPAVLLRTEEIALDPDSPSEFETAQKAVERARGRS
jgi:hypothetical protein